MAPEVKYPLLLYSSVSASRSRSKSSVVSFRFLYGAVSSLISASDIVVLPVTMMSRTKTCKPPGFFGASPSGGSGTIGRTGLGGGCGRWNSSFNGPGGSPDLPVGSTCPPGNCPRAGDVASPTMANPTMTHQTQNAVRPAGAG